MSRWSRRSAASLLTQPWLLVALTIYAANLVDRVLHPAAQPAAAGRRSRRRPTTASGRPGAAPALRELRDGRAGRDDRLPHEREAPAVVIEAPRAAPRDPRSRTSAARSTWPRRSRRRGCSASGASGSSTATPVGADLVARQHLHRHRGGRPEVAPGGAARPAGEPGRRDRRHRLLRAGGPRGVRRRSIRRAARRQPLEGRAARGDRAAGRPGRPHGAATRASRGRCRPCLASRSTGDRRRPRVGRADAGVRQGPGRLLVLLHLLHHPGGARPGASLSPETVLLDVRRALRAGHREIVLTGINVGTYDGGWSERGFRGSHTAVGADAGRPRPADPRRDAGRAAAPLVDRAAARRRRPARRLGRRRDRGRCPTSTCRSSRATTASSGGWDGGTLGRLRRARRPRSATAHPRRRDPRRRHRRLPDRGRRRVAAVARLHRSIDFAASTSSATRHARARRRSGWPARSTRGPEGERSRAARHGRRREGALGRGRRSDAEASVLFESRLDDGRWVGHAADHALVAVDRPRRPVARERHRPRPGRAVDPVRPRARRRPPRRRVPPPVHTPPEDPMAADPTACSARSPPATSPRQGPRGRRRRRVPRHRAARPDPHPRDPARPHRLRRRPDRGPRAAARPPVRDDRRRRPSRGDRRRRLSPRDRTSAAGAARPSTTSTSTCSGAGRSTGRPGEAAARAVGAVSPSSPASRSRRRRRLRHRRVAPAIAGIPAGAGRRRRRRSRRPSSQTRAAIATAPRRRSLQLADAEAAVPAVRVAARCRPRRAPSTRSSLPEDPSRRLHRRLRVPATGAAVDAGQRDRGVSRERPRQGRVPARRQQSIRQLGTTLIFYTWSPSTSPDPGSAQIAARAEDARDRVRAAALSPPRPPSTSHVRPSRTVSPVAGSLRPSATMSTTGLSTPCMCATIGESG